MSQNEVWVQLRTLLKDDATLQDSSHLNAADLDDYIVNGYPQTDMTGRGLMFVEVGRRRIDGQHGLEEIVMDFTAWGDNFEAVLDRVHALLNPTIGNPFNLGTNGAAQPSDRLISVSGLGGSGPLLRLGPQRVLARVDTHIILIGR